MTEQDESLIMDYVLGELDEFTRARLEARLEREPELAVALAEAEEAIARGILADTPEVSDVSASLRDQILEIAEPVSTPAGGSTGQAQAKTHWASFGGWGIAATLAVVAAVLAERSSDRESEVRSLQEQVAVKQAAMIRVSSELAAVIDERELLANRIAGLNSKRALDQMQIATLSSQLEQASYGFAVFDTQANEGVIEVVNLPEVQSSQDYQLWVVDPQYPNPVDGGIVQVSADGRASVRFSAKQQVDSVAAFAISLEKKGGVPVAEGPMVLVGAL